MEIKIDNNLRLKHNLSYHEYVFMYFIKKFSVIKGGFCIGCCLKRCDIADMMGLSYDCIMRMQRKLIIKGFVKKHGNDKDLILTDKLWSEL